MNQQDPTKDRHTSRAGRKGGKPGEPQPATSLSAKKMRVFFAITLTSPILLVCLLELGLRAFHWGPDLSLFTTVDIRGTTYHCMNPDVGARFFSGAARSPATSPDRFRVPKPAGTFRIFCLGGSTTVGYPYWYNASFSTFLRDRLRRLFPERRIEIINIGMTAVNSYTVVDFARELTDYEPDLLIVYDGHNEFYGALGVASRDTFGGSRWMNMLSLRLIHSRLFLLLRETYVELRTLVSGRSEQSIRGVTMELLARGRNIPYGGALYAEALQIFEANLDELRSICRTHNISVILGTQVSNLRGQLPFVAGENPGITTEGRTAFAAHLASGQSAWNQGRWDAALVSFKTAAALDSLHAGARFAVARCLDILGRRTEARSEYMRARDYDQLRFRTSSDFNRLIARMEDSTTVGVVDVEQIFMGSSPDSLIGSELILEHLHPNSFGHFLMAKGFASVMRLRGLLGSREDRARRDTVLDRVLWDARPLTHLDERVAARRTQIMISNWPFVDRSQPVPDVETVDTLGQIAERIVDGTWGWGDGHQAAAAYYAGNSDAENLEREYKTLIALVPLEAAPHCDLASLYVQQNRVPEAHTALLASIEAEPTAFAYRNLGELAFRAGKTAEAIEAYEKTFSFPQSPDEEAENGYMLARAYMEVKQPARAEARLRRVLSVKPGHLRSAVLLKSIEQQRSRARRAGGNG